MKRCWFCRTNRKVNHKGSIPNPCPWESNRYMDILICDKCKENHMTYLKEYWDRLGLNRYS